MESWTQVQRSIDCLASILSEAKDQCQLCLERSSRSDFARSVELKRSEHLGHFPQGVRVSARSKALSRDQALGSFAVTDQVQRCARAAR
eukprot:1108863-Pleurochrysis_carterae.AAC.1